MVLCDHVVGSIFSPLRAELFAFLHLLHVVRDNAMWIGALANEENLGCNRDEVAVVSTRSALYPLSFHVPLYCMYCNIKMTFRLQGLSFIHADILS